MKIYRYVKKYYNIRSKLVHGEIISVSEHSLIHDFFKFISTIILQIIIDNKKILIFNNNKSRQKYLDELLFS